MLDVYIPTYQFWPIYVELFVKVHLELFVAPSHVWCIVSMWHWQKIKIGFMVVWQNDERRLHV